MKTMILIAAVATVAAPPVAHAATGPAAAAAADSPQRAAPQPARDAGGLVDPAGWLVSEKYDGVRALWDGRVLRFRSGAPVPAPAWFLERLPSEPLDGELWLGRGRFEALSGLVRRGIPDEDGWRELRYMVFDLPAAPERFAERAARIERLVAAAAWPQLVAVVQAPAADRAALRRRLDEVVRAGGEGLMLHRADAPPASASDDGSLLKLKPRSDAEATVIGHLPGRGRHAGRLGALRVRTPEGREFSLGTGFSDAQRAEPPPLGSTVTYTYRGLTAGGLPRFASFLRVRTAP